MTSRIELPLPPQRDDRTGMEIYARFMSHMRQVPHRRQEIKILSAIQFTATMMDYTDAQISKMLVDMGLRVGRDGFPADYLEFADCALMRSGWDVGGPSGALLELREYWEETGEDKFAPFRREYAFAESALGCV